MSHPRDWDILLNTQTPSLVDEFVKSVRAATFVDGLDTMNIGKDTQIVFATTSHFAHDDVSMMIKKYTNDHHGISVSAEVDDGNGEHMKYKSIDGDLNEYNAVIQWVPVTRDKKPASGNADTDIGKRILSRDGRHTGTITNIVRRYCAACGTVGPVYSVRWDDGKRTFPCPAGCKKNNDNTIQIGGR